MKHETRDIASQIPIYANGTSTDQGGGGSTNTGGTGGTGDEG